MSGTTVFPDVGHADGESCSPGTYSDTGTTPCVAATAGHYVKDAGATSQTPCELGKYQSKPGQNTCIPASRGYYVDRTGQPMDTECPPGKTTLSTGQVLCVTPSALIPLTPYLWWWADAEPATPGHQLYFSVKGETGLAGTYTLYEEGEVPASGTALASVTLTGTSGGDTKSVTTVADVTNSTLFSVRFESADSNYVSRDFKRFSAICGAGRYSSDGNGPCLLAPAGRFVELSGSTESVPCPLGAYEPEEGAMACRLADPGTHVNLTGATSPDACATGTYSDTYGAIECEQASLGYYVDTPGAVYDTECAVGTTTTSTGQTSCVSVAPAKIPAMPAIQWLEDPDPLVTGHIVRVTVAAASGLEGTFEVFANGSVPNSGSALTSISVTSGGGAKEVEVETGDVTADTRFSVRFTSSNSDYVTRDFKWIRAACAAGRYSTTGYGPCLPAPAGKYVGTPGQTSYSECPRGQYQPDAGMAECIPADAGTYVDTLGATYAELCPLGSYQPGTGSSSCVPASIGYFVGMVGAISQSACPSGTTTTSTGQFTCTPTSATTTTTPPTAAKKSPSVPKLVRTIKVGRSATVSLNKGKNRNGLVTKVSSKSKTCKVVKTSKGYSIKGLKRGRCVLLLSITGNATYASLTRTGAISIRS